MGVFLGSTSISLYAGGSGNSGPIVIPTGIKVVNPPAKISYKAGEQIDISGIVIKVTYSDNTEVDVTSECTFSPADKTIIYEDTTQIDIAWTWQETINYTTIQPITVEKVIENVVISSAPTKIIYNAGDELDLTGLQVIATYNSGNTEDVTAKCAITPVNGTVIYEDITAITIVYGNKTLSQPITVNKVLSSISLTGPTKTNYNKGETLNLNGLVVTAHYNSGATENVTSYTTNPANGATLNTLGNQSVTVSYTVNGVTKTATFEIKVGVKTVTWAGGTDSEVQAMIEAAHAGVIKLSDYWAVGDTRTVSLSAGTNSAGTAIPAQNVELVLAHKPTSTSYYGGGEFIINQKHCLTVTNYMNSTNTNNGSFNGSAMASFLNNSSTGYLKMLPTWLSSVLLNAKVITAQTYNGTTNQTSTHKVFLPAGKEVFGTDASSGTSYGGGYSNYTEANALEQWDWFKTSANRIKQVNGSNNYWWERSPNYNGGNGFCYVHYDGGAGSYIAGYSYGVAPAMLI